ncbi:MAG: methyl-accepting chemotaxis protein, partial [Clostridium sp.]
MKSLNKSLKKKMIFVSASTLILSIGLILIFSAFVITKEVKHDNKVVLHEIAQRSAKEIEEYINTNKVLVQTIATSFTVDGDNIVADTSTINEYMEQYNLETFIVAKPDGSATTNANKELEVSDREYFKRAIKGELYASSPIVDRISGDLSIAYSAPIKQNGEIKGVVAIIRNADTLSEKIKNITFLDTGNAILIDSEGNTIAHKDFEKVKNKENLIEMAKTDKDAVSVAKIVEKMKAGQSGTEEYTRQGSNRVMSYVYIDSLGWNLGLFVDTSDLHVVVEKVITAILVVGFIELIIVIVGISLYVDKTLVRRLKVNVDAIKEFAKGNFNQHLPEKELNREDEIGQILQAINSSQQSLSDMIISVKESSNVLNGEASNLAAISEEYVSTCDNIITATKESAEGTSSQAAQISDIAMSMNTFEDNLNSMVDTVSNIDNMLKDITEKSSVSSAEMIELVKTVQGVEENFKGFLWLLSKVETRIKDITSITDVIQRISEQTNLLALNAAIEAARAGEAGRGFSVVASEIRGLAEESKESANEITQIVKGILEETVEMVAGSEDINNDLSKQIIKTNSASESFDTIINLVSEVANEMDSLNGTSTQLIDEKGSIVDNISNSSAISEELSAATEEIYASTSELAASSTEV